MRRHAALLVLLVAFALPTFAESRPHPDPKVSLNPAFVVAGAPELVRLRAPGATIVEGEWLGRKVEFFSAAPGEWAALAGVDVETPAGPSALHIAIHDTAATRQLTIGVDIHPAHYRTAALSVAPRFVSPPPEEIAEIEAEVKLKQEVFAHSAPEPLWHGDFRAPLASRPTDSFGTRRMFNGKLASIHKGADFHAATGTPVRASNSGIVVLARKLYFEGNCVVVDHGLGLYTLSMHLSRIDVHDGDQVRTGQLLGLSGATGRVTGPHLHWAVRWQNAYLDPVKLLKMNLTGLP